MPPTQPRPNTNTAAQSHQVLDPRTMGRPVHLVGKFTRQLLDDLTQLFCTPLNRRYRAKFEIAAVSLAALTSPPDLQRWRVYASGSGRIGFAIDRDVLLCVLGYRYGIHEGKSASQAAADPPPDTTDDAPPTPAIEPETASEERLAAMLGQQLVSVLAECVQALHPVGGEPAPASAPDITFAETAATLPIHTGWTLRADVVEGAHNIRGAMWFRLDESWVTRLLQGLAVSRKRTGSPAAAALEPLPNRLQLTLVARLLEKQVSLGTLLDTRAGDVIPVSLGTCDVLIGDSRLFTAGITEHKGKLCLTSFEDVE